MSLKPGAIEEAYEALGITREDMTRRIRNSAKDMAIEFAITDAAMNGTLGVLDQLVAACHRNQAVLTGMGRNGTIRLRGLYAAGIFRSMADFYFTDFAVAQIDKNIAHLTTEDFHKMRKYKFFARQIALAAMIVQETDRFRRVPEFEIDSTAEAANERADRALEARAGSERGVSTYFGGLATRRPRRENLSP